MTTAAAFSPLPKRLVHIAAEGVQKIKDSISIPAFCPTRIKLMFHGKSLRRAPIREVALGKRRRRILVHGFRGQIEALDSRIGQARHLPLARQDLQRGVDLVGGIDLAVPVGVVCLEGVEASEGQGPIRQGHDVAEQLTSVVRLAVEVLVQHQKRVRLVDPPRELVEPVGVQVKERRVLQIYLPVPVQVQDQWVAADRGAPDISQRKNISPSSYPAENPHVAPAAEPIPGKFDPTTPP